MDKIAQTCIATAKDVLAGKIDFEEFKTRWPIAAENDRLLWRLMHETEHFLVDDDIRRKDASYEDYQRNLIGSLIADAELKYTKQL